MAKASGGIAIAPAGTIDPHCGMGMPAPGAGKPSRRTMTPPLVAAQCRRASPVPRRGMAKPRRVLTAQPRGTAKPAHRIAVPLGGTAISPLGMAVMRREMRVPPAGGLEPPSGWLKPSSGLAMPRRGLVMPWHGMLKPRRVGAKPARVWANPSGSGQTGVGESLSPLTPRRGRRGPPGGLKGRSPSLDILCPADVRKRASLAHTVSSAAASGPEETSRCAGRRPSSFSCS
jgi:hypothetical protein